MSYSQIASQLTQIQNNTAAVNYQTGQNNLGSSTLDKDSFMQLLMAQLANQDPMNPVEDSEFLSQQAMMTQVEQLDNLNTTLALSTQAQQASALVGKYVEIAQVSETTGETEYIYGQVEGAVFGSDGAAVSVDGVNYPISQVTAATDASMWESDGTGTDTGTTTEETSG